MHLILRLRNKIKIDKSTKLQISKDAKIVQSIISVKGKNNTIIIGKKSLIRNSFIEIVGNNCQIIIGNNVMIGDNCYLSAKEEHISLIIKDNCALSRNVKIMTSDGHPIFSNNKRINPAKDITIHNHVWIGDNVTILKNVTIGENSVIGINSTVTKDVPSNSIAAGNPAKIVKENITWQDKL